jgi:anti-anti-sigma regulatory factor
MWKVRRIADGEFVVLLLSGRIDGEHLLELQRIFVSEDGNLNLILDMKEVKLVDQEVVRFLLSCEAGGIRLRNCPAYIREWIRRGETRKGI